MALTKLFQRYTFTDAHLNAVLQDYRRKMNEVVDYFLNTDFGSLALYDTDQSDILSLKWNENDSNPRTLNLKVNNADRTISMSGNLTVEGASLINSDLTTDANWLTSGSITAGSLVIDGNTLTLSGNNKVVTWEATTSMNLRSNAELRFYDNGNYVGFEAPALGADCIWVLPTIDGGANEVLYTDGSKTLAWGSYAGNVTATANFGTDNVLIRSDGTLKALQHSGIVIDNSDNISGVGTIASGDITVDAKLVFSAGSITDADGAISFGNENLSTTGTLGCGATTTPSVLAAGSGNESLSINGNGTGTLRSTTLYAKTSVETENVFVSDSGYMFRSTSGKKYKDKIKDLELDSSGIYQLRPRSYNSLCEMDNKDKRFIGLIADEIEPIYPDIINYNKNNEVESYDSKMLMTLLLAEVQVLRTEINELKNK